MSSSRADPQKTASFMNSTNPEILRISPRPGGALRIDGSSFFTSTKIGEDLLGPPKDFQLSLVDKVSKEFRVQTALDETHSLDSEDVTLPNPLKDAMYMFGVAISGIIMMAANHPNIPQEYYKWTADCLECIRDDFGNHPPNVQGILNHINHTNPKMGGATSAYSTKSGKSGGASAAGASTVGGESGVGGEDVAGGGGGGPDAPEEGGKAEREVGGEAEGEAGGEAGAEAGEEQTVRTTTRVQMGSKDEVVFGNN